jgi:hypothetical protein
MEWDFKGEGFFCTAAGSINFISKILILYVFNLHFIKSTLLSRTSIGTDLWYLGSIFQILQSIDQGMSKNIYSFIADFNEPASSLASGLTGPDPTFASAADLTTKKGRSPFSLSFMARSLIRNKKQLFWARKLPCDLEVKGHSPMQGFAGNPG